MLYWSKSLLKLWTWWFILRLYDLLWIPRLLMLFAWLGRVMNILVKTISVYLSRDNPPNRHLSWIAGTVKLYEGGFSSFRLFTEFTLRDAMHRSKSVAWVKEICRKVADCTRIKQNRFRKEKSSWKLKIRVTNQETQIKQWYFNFISKLSSDWTSTEDNPYLYGIYNRK